MTNSSDPILQFFGYAHLSAALQPVSKPFCDLAQLIVATLPPNAEREAALRKLLESKDCAVRAAFYKAVVIGPEVIAVPAVVVEEAPAEPEMPDAMEAFLKAIAGMELPGEAVAIWIEHRKPLGLLSPSEREHAWKKICETTEKVGHLKHAKVWLKRAIAEEDMRKNSTPVDERF